MLKRYLYDKQGRFIPLDRLNAHRSVEMFPIRREEKSRGLGGWWRGVRKDLNL
jgi:hypothetical protein